MPEVMDENELDLTLEENAVEKRIKSLSEKVKLTAQDRDEKDRLLKERDEQLATITKEKDFYASFNTSISKYPGATEYQDKIKEKVMSGYDVEDATVAILAREGKLTNAPTPPPIKENPAGGSAVTNTGGGEKALDEMSKDEKRAKLIEALGNRSLNG